MNELEQQAIKVLKEDFHPDLEYQLTLEHTFNSHPFREGGGPSALFSFIPDPQSSDKYFVVAGNVLPMIYPDWGLSTQDIWALHIGMEYFIKMGVTEDSSKQPARMLAYLKMVQTVFQEQLYIVLTSTPKIEKVYVIQDQRHVVGKVTYEGLVYSWIVGDITHFVYKKDLPPQATWSLHMGRILLT